MSDAKPRIDEHELQELELEVAAILDLPEADRPAEFEALRAARPGRAALIARLERSARALDDGQSPIVAVAEIARQPSVVDAPKQIGDYKILDVLGEGGMGTVYLAEQQQPVRRRVALKVIKAGMDSKDVIARFEAERQALALMSHPNIAKVLDAGTIPGDGRPFFALEHVPGLAITEFCDRQKVDLRGRIELFQKICRGVQHAHQKGVIHRDLKPTNILVQQRDGFAEPKIIDFGVAKALQQRLTERTLYTEQGRIVGTPEYMSPEQAEMSGLDIDTRSDIYSLGVLLYELLAGQLPFDPRELRAAGYYEMQRKIREEDPDRPSTRCTQPGKETAEIAKRRCMDPRDLQKALHGDIDWIVMRCLEKDPARRYQASSELAADLQRHLDDEPVEAGPPSASYRFGKFVKKRRGSIIAAAAFVGALAGGLSMALWQWSAARASAARAESNLVSARENEQRAVKAEQKIETELRRSIARNIAAASDRARASVPIEALMLGLKAVEYDGGPETLACVQDALADQCAVAEFRGHEGRVTDVTIGARSRRVLTAGYDGTVRVWTFEGEELSVLRHAGPVRSASFSADEAHILTVSATADGHEVARRFSREGRLLDVIGGADSPPLFRSLAWSPDGSRLLAISAEGAGPVQMLDPTGAAMQQLVPESITKRGGIVFPVAAAGFSAAGHALVRRNSRQVWIWPSSGDACIELFQRGMEIVGGSMFGGPGIVSVPRLRLGRIALDPRGQLVATVGDAARLWSSDGELLATLGEGVYRPSGVHFSPSGDAILVVFGDGTARVFARNGKQRAVCNHGTHDGMMATYFGSDSRLVTSHVGGLKLWNESGRLLATLSGQNGRYVDIQDSVPAEGLIVTTTFGARGPGWPTLWRVSGAEPLRLRTAQDRPWVTASCPDGSVCVTGESGRVEVLDDAGRVVKRFDTGVREPTYGVAVSPDGSVLVAGGAGARLYAWRWDTEELLWVKQLTDPRGRRMPLTSVAFLGDGERIVATAAPAGVAFWVDLAAGSHRVFASARDADSGGWTGRPWWLTPTPDGQRFALHTRTGQLRFYDSAGRHLAELQAHDGEFSNLAFHPDGARFATASVASGIVRVWALRDVLAHPDTVSPEREIPGTGVAFAPEGAGMLLRRHGFASVLDADGAEVMRVRASDEGGLPGSFSLDGRWLLGRTYDGVQRWPVSRDELLRLGRRQVQRLGGDRDLSGFAHLWER